MNNHDLNPSSDGDGANIRHFVRGFTIFRCLNRLAKLWQGRRLTTMLLYETLVIECA